MQSEDFPPPGEIQLLCPHCQGPLLIEHDGPPRPSDPMFCPEHGVIGTRAALTAELVEQLRNAPEPLGD